MKVLFTSVMCLERGKGMLLRGNLAIGEDLVITIKSIINFLILFSSIVLEHRFLNVW